MRPSILAVQVIFLIALQAVAVVVLWLLNPVTQVATDVFALYLSLGLLCFAIISYVYRSKRAAKEPSATWLAIGYFSLMVLLVSALAIVA